MGGLRTPRGHSLVSLHIPNVQDGVGVARTQAQRLVHHVVHLHVAPSARSPHQEPARNAPWGRLSRHEALTLAKKKKQKTKKQIYGRARRHLSIHPSIPAVPPAGTGRAALLRAKIKYSRFLLSLFCSAYDSYTIILLSLMDYPFSSTGNCTKGNWNPTQGVTPAWDRL